MKLSNQRMLEDMQKLGGIAQKPLPVKASYAIAKNISKFESELRAYGKEREKLIEKYAEKDNEGKVVCNEEGQITFKDQEGWEKDINLLLEIENEVNIHKFSIAELEGYNMTPAELMLIEYMIED